MDAADFYGVGELFADAALFDPDGNELARGRDSVSDFYRRIVILHDGSPRTLHTTVNPIIELDADAQSAVARSAYVVYQSFEGPPAAIVAGRYRDRFQRVGAEWRFAERRFFVEHMGDTSNHLRAVALGG